MRRKRLFIVETWIEALRGGKYTRAVGRLRDGERKFCCLGVLCDLVNPLLWHSDGEYETGDKMPPDDFGEEIVPFAEMEKYSDLNDSGSSFAVIADTIEADYREWQEEEV